jgi:hypothetical protein
MEDQHLDSRWVWRETEWETAFFKGLVSLGVLNRPDGRDGDRTPIMFVEGVLHYTQLMYRTHRAAVLAVACTVGYVEATAQMVHDARSNGAPGLAADLERRRTWALDRASAVFTRAIAHRDDLEAIQLFGTAMLARGDATLRAKHRFGTGLDYAVPGIQIPEELYEIGQARVRVALEVLTGYPITDLTRRTRRRTRLSKSSKAPPGLMRSTGGKSASQPGWSEPA